MTRNAITAFAFGLATLVTSCTNQGNAQSGETLKPTSAPVASCDRPYVVSEGESKGKPEFIRVDKFYDQDLSKTLLDKKAASSIQWAPQPEWDNQDEVVKAVDEVSPDAIKEQPFPYVEGIEAMLKNSDQSPGFLGYYAATPLTYNFSVHCQNDQDNLYQLSFSTWTDSDLGIIDCNLKLDKEAPKAASKAYGAYCQES
ncbi:MULTISPECIES: hypothetical protein [Glutamicibacter]|uniref:Uncharacterized protein n=1 Tax=Glutamicibacter halophytocola TaxID=1933880 RepID=A0AA95BQ28_9MICC|nr:MULTISPECIES: hypothetical protein [Glutamicibacter]MBF6670401.1 hypothetical protein [Glutamicibacter sp. FBE19]UUX58795.1 hypothetical protein NUH22_16125 [Glutamicibacter halophytocola]